MVGMLGSLILLHTEAHQISSAISVKRELLVYLKH
jgi:hypothetical protein